MNKFLYIAVLPQLIFSSTTVLTPTTTPTSTPVILPASSTPATTSPATTTLPKVATSTPTYTPSKISTTSAPSKIATTSATTTKEKPHTTSAATSTAAATTFVPPKPALLASVPIGDVYAQSQPFTPWQTRLFISIALALLAAGILLVEQTRLRILSRRLDRAFAPRVETQL